jgi:hypothetical protein
MDAAARTTANPVPVGDDPIPPHERARTLRKAAFLTAGVGVVHAVLFLVAFWLLSDLPGPNASNEEIEAFYSSDSSRRPVVVGLYLMPFAAIAFVWFIVAVRMWISGQVRRENVLLSNVQLVAGILYVALFCGGAAASSVLAASVEFSDGPIDPVVAHQFPQFGSALLFVFAVRMAAMFVFTTTNITKAAGLLPRWFVWAGYLVGAFLLLSATFNSTLVLVFPIWLLVLCAILLTRARRIPADIMVDEFLEARREQAAHVAPGRATNP